MGRRIRFLLLILLGAILLFVLAKLSGLFGGILGTEDRPRGPSDPSGGASGAVEGRVLSSSGRAPPAGTRVTAEGQKHSATAMTDENGRFRFRDLPAGTTELTASSGPLVARAPVTDEPVEIRLPGKCVIGGRVVSALTAESIPRAVVRCAGRTLQADDRGAFRFPEIDVPDARPPEIEVASPDHLPLRVTPPLDRRWDDLFLRMKARE